MKFTQQKTKKGLITTVIEPFCCDMMREFYRRRYLVGLNSKMALFIPKRPIIRDTKGSPNFHVGQFHIMVEPVYFCPFCGTEIEVEQQ